MPTKGDMIRSLSAEFDHDTNGPTHENSDLNRARKYVDEIESLGYERARSDFVARIENLKIDALSQNDDFMNMALTWAIEEIKKP